jgi:hypothetical protein
MPLWALGHCLHGMLFIALCFNGFTVGIFIKRADASMKEKKVSNFNFACLARPPLFRNFVMSNFNFVVYEKSNF